MQAVDIAFAVGWVAFWAYWLLASRRVKGTRPGASETRQQLHMGLRIGIGIVVVILLKLRVFRVRTIPGGPALLAVGVLIFVAGLGLAVWARWTIGRNWGAPMSQKADPDLVTAGPYRRIRHPIYSGMVLALVGMAVATSFYWLIVAAVLGAYFFVSARAEERYMTGVFPDDYPEYKRHTRMLIPFIL